MKFVFSLLFSIVFTGVLAGIYLFHAWHLPVQVIFYSAMEDAFVATIVTAALVFTLRRRLPFGGFERFLLVLVWLLAGYGFAISGPAVLDRSLSFYILEKLQQRGGGIREDAISQVFVNEYLPEFRLVDVRLTEQLQSGTIEIVNGCVRLTDWGQRLASFSHFTRTHLLARHRLLAGVYTDALVDPLAHGAQGPQGYECH